MTALAFKAAIDDPKRFTSSTKVGPYLGLTPRQYQSGESEWIGGIGKSNDPLLRAILYEAAGVLMTRVCARSCPLKALGRCALPSASAGSAPPSPLRASSPSSCTPSGATAPSSSGARRGGTSLIARSELPRKRKASLPGRRAD